MKDCRASMLHDSMDLGRLMVHAQQVDGSRCNKSIHERKKPKTAEQTGSRSSRGSFRVQKRPKFKRHSGNSASSGNLNVKVTESGARKGNDQNILQKSKLCGKCGRPYGGDCLVGINSYFGCGKTGHMVQDYPQMMN